MPSQTINATLTSTQAGGAVQAVLTPKAYPAAWNHSVQAEVTLTATDDVFTLAATL